MIYNYANFCLHMFPYYIILKVFKDDLRFTKGKLLKKNFCFLA